MLPVSDIATETLAGSREPRQRRTKSRQDNDDGYVFRWAAATS